MGAMLCRRVLMAMIVGVLGVLASASVASAASFTVNDPTDAALATPTDTNCASTNAGSCTLRAAVQAADNAGGASTITLPSGTYKLTIPPAGYPSNASCTTTYESGGDGCDSNDPANGDLDVLSGATVTITGAGSGTTTIDAGGIDRAFAVQSGGGLLLSGVTIQNGQPSGLYCYSTYYAMTYTCAPSSGLPYATAGGAIYSDGALTTTGDVTLRGNQAVSQNNSGSGGAIYAGIDSTTLSLTGTTLAANYAPSGSALYDDTSVAGTISGSTFVQNDAAGGQGTIYGAYATGTGQSLNITATRFSNNVAGSGGAIYWYSPGSLTADGGNTFTGNAADAGGVLYNNYYSHPTSLSGDIIKNNTAYDAAVIYQDDYSGSSGDSVTLNNDEIEGNTATYVGVGYFAAGAAPSSANSSYVGNSGADGGVFYLATAATGEVASLTNVTMTGNSSNYGGAMYLSSTATDALTLVNDTIAFNTASGAGGGIYGASYATPGGGGVTNTIVAKNSGGDCSGGASPQFAAAADSGNNADGDASCFGYSGHPASDEVGVNPALSPAAYNGGPNAVQTLAEHAGGPTVNAGNNAACPATDARGFARPLSAADACDIGAFEALSSSLSLSNAAPATASSNQPFNETITASAIGAASPSTTTTIVDQLPAGETVYGAAPSQGSCSTSSSPARVTCVLGLLAPGASATVKLVVAEAVPGTLTNTALGTNDEGSSVGAAATTQVAASSALGTAPVAYTGPVGMLKQKSATLSGVINPGGQPTGFFFQYGLTSRYGGSTSVGHTGSATQGVLAGLAGLSPATKYHYRVVAINDSGTSYGRDVTFKTKGTSAGKLVLGSRKLAVLSGKVHVPLTCGSSKRCLGGVSITTRVQSTASGHVTTVVCTSSRSARYRIKAHKRKVVKFALLTPCMTALSSNGGTLGVVVAVRPRSGQLGVVKLATVFLK